MRILAILVTFVFASCAFALDTAFELNMQYSVDGITVSRPKITVKEGELASVEVGSDDGTTFFEVVASDHQADDKDNVLIKMKVGRILEDGTRQTLSEPTVVTRIGEEASVSQVISKSSGEETSEMKVIANRKSL